MVARRVGVLALCGLMVTSMVSCARSGTDTLDVSAAVSDTVDLPGALPGLVASEAVAAPAAQIVLVADAVYSPTTTAAPAQTSSSSSSSPSSSTSSTMPSPVLRRATLEFTGDTLIHSPLVRQAAVNAGGVGFDFAPMFAEVQPILGAADLAICHLETPVAPPGAALSTYPVYGVPLEIASALAGAGYDRCSTASNHTIDRGTAGIDATVNALEAAGLSQTGMAREPAEAVSSLVDVQGISVAHLSYTFGFNGAHLPAGESWRSNLIDSTAIIAAASAARARGAEVVILSLHWGTEGRSAITPAQMSVADAVTRSGAVDLIVGHHAHVIQPIAEVNGTWVVFGMGNFLSNMPTGDQWPASSQDGMIVSVSLTERAEGGFQVDRPVVTPTWVDRSDGFVIRPVIADLADPALDDATRAQLEASLWRTTSVVGEYLAG